MVKKYLSHIIVFVLFSFQMQAQSMFSIKITQIYPAGGIVYGNAYNLSSEFETAEKKLYNQYSSKAANYIIELTSPGGIETKSIQNIHWILIKNGVEENLKSKPKTKESYPKVTSIEIYACNNNGLRKENKENILINYDHYYKFYINHQEQTIDSNIRSYMSDKKCKDLAKAYFDKHKPGVDSILCEVRIFKGKDILVDSTNNREAYKKFKEEQLRKKEQTARMDSVKVKVPDTTKIIHTTDSLCKKKLEQFDENIKKIKDENKLKIIQDSAFAVAMDCISIDSVYNFNNINVNLELCLKAATNYLIEGSNFLTNLILIRDKLNSIINIMENNPKKKLFKFDRNMFNTGERKRLIAGIKELIKRNKILTK